MGDVSLADLAVDILIIGSGASGAAAAWRLSDAGFRIMCLEQGQWQKPEEYAPGFADWEFRAASNFHFNPNVRGLPEDYPVNDTASAYQPADVQRRRRQHDPLERAFPRFHPSDFRVRSLDGVADDWPLTYDELEPYYDLNDRMIGVSGIAGDPANPPRSPRQTPPLPLGPVGETIARGFDRLGWHWWPSDSAIITRGLRRAAPPATTAAPAASAARPEPKLDADVTYWPARACASASSCGPRAACARSPSGRTAAPRGARYFDATARRSSSRPRRGDRRRQRHRHAAPAAAVAVRRHPGRARELERPGRQQPDVPPLSRSVTGFFDDGIAPTWQGAARQYPDLAGVLRDRSLRAASCAAIPSR